MSAVRPLDKTVPVPSARPGDHLPAKLARRIALAAQGLADPRPATTPDSAALLRQIRRLGLLQLDSVSVLVRAHYLPLFSRLGGYDRATLDRLAGHDGTPVPRRRRRLFEYWAHEASLLPVELQPQLRWRMARARAGQGVWRSVAAFGRERPEAVERVFEEVAACGPLGVSALEEPGVRSEAWWGWSQGKAALEWLFWTGRLTAAGRRGFERLYDLPERVLPSDILERPDPSEPEALRVLMAHAATACGVATESDLRDYFRLPVAGARRALAELVEAGSLRPVAVEGWRQQAYLAEGARMPRRAQASALLAPFDPLVWERARTERLFGFRYRLEIYTPAHKREHGYYVLPFLQGDRLAARVDLKTERTAGRLAVRGAHLEAGVASDAVAGPLAEELVRMAAWLALDELAVEASGTLATELLARLRATSGSSSRATACRGGG